MAERNSFTARLRDIARDAVRIDPAPGAWRVGVRAGGVLLVLLFGLFAIDRLDLAMPASFGVFTSVYAGRVPTTGRWRIQARHGAVMVSAVALGAAVALSPSREWLAIPVAAVAAGVGAWFSDRQGWRPPGSLFIVFAVAGCASIPATPVQALQSVGVTVLAALLSLAAGVIEVAVSKRGTAAPTPPPSGEAGILVARNVVAVASAGGLATWLGIGHPYWAMVSAVVPLVAPKLRHQFIRGTHRVAGTLIGVGLTALILVFEPAALAIIIIVPLLQGVVESGVPRDDGIALVFITPLALLLGYQAYPVPIVEMLTDRVIETVIGVVIGMLVVVTIKRRRVEGGSPRRAGQA